MVAGHHHYGLWLAQMAQPVLALCLPPLAWLAFVAGVRRPLAAQDLWHLVAPGAGLSYRPHLRRVLPTSSARNVIGV